MLGVGRAAHHWKLQRRVASVSWLQTMASSASTSRTGPISSSAATTNVPCRERCGRDASSVIAQQRSQLLGEAHEHRVVAGEAVGELQEHVGADYTNIEQDASTATGNILPPGSQRPQDGAIPSVRPRSPRRRRRSAATSRSRRRCAIGCSSPRRCAPIRTARSARTSSASPTRSSACRGDVRRVVLPEMVVHQSVPPATARMARRACSPVDIGARHLLGRRRSMCRAKLGTTSGTDTPAPSRQHARQPATSSRRRRPSSRAGFDARMFNNKLNLELHATSASRRATR